MKTFILFISGPEIFVILLLVVMLFGADKLPEIARGLGRGIRQVKDATNEIKREINDSVEKQGIDTEFLKDVNEQVKEVKNKVEEFQGPIKRSR